MQNGDPLPDRRFLVSFQKHLKAISHIGEQHHDRQILKRSQHRRNRCVDKHKLHLAKHIVCKFQRYELIYPDCTDNTKDDTDRPYRSLVFQLHSCCHLRNVHTEVYAHQHKTPVGTEHMYRPCGHRTAEVHKGENVL